jgi:hypothetical protein
VSDTSYDAPGVASPSQSQVYQEGGSRGWGGWISFGAVIVILIGIMHGIAGLTALFNDDYYLVTKRDLVVNVDYTAWGWIHLLFGVFAILVGLGMLKRQLWARVVGVIFAGFSIILNLGFLNAHPVWSVIVIAFDLALIWALTVHGHELDDTGSTTRPLWSSPYGPS